MNLLLALAAGTLFGCGAYLLLKPDLFRIVVGIVLISNAANVTLIASGVTRGNAPVRPFEGERVSDPLVQAMTVTALVIGFAVTALLLAMIVRIHQSEKTVDLDELGQAEQKREQALEREGGS